jgi:hypothetical protein
MSELKNFILRHEAVKLYRTFLKSIREAPKESHGMFLDSLHSLAQQLLESCTQLEPCNSFGLVPKLCIANNEFVFSEIICKVI